MPITLDALAIGPTRASARNGNVWIAAGSDESCYRSTDGGETWSPIDIDAPLYATARDCCYDAGVWLIVGDEGFVSRSIDNGISWTAETSGTSSQLTRVMPAPGGGFIAIGQSGTVITSPGGVTWTARTHAHGTTSFVAIATDGSTVLIGGGSAKIARSDDGGATWTTVTISAIGTSTIYNIVHVSGRWIVCSSNRRVSTSTDLSTWSSTQLPESENSGNGNPYAATGTDTCWLVGTVGGRIYRSTNGTSWTEVYDYEDYIALYYADASADTIAVLGANGHLIQSDDDGLTWAHTTTLSGVIFGIDYGAGGWIAHTSTTLYIALEEAPAATTASLGWPITVTPAPTVTCSLSWPITVATPAVRALSWPVRIIAASAVGGLDGAGGWPAAPSGRWAPVIVLDGNPINPIGPVTVDQADNAASTAEFAFRPVSPLQPMSLTGRPVRIAFAERGPAGEVINAQTMFTGVIDVPSIDIATGVITCSCTDQLQEVISNTPRDWINANLGGRWRAEVSGEPADNWEYCEARRASVPASIALDALQQPRVIPWRGEGLRTYTVRGADHLDGLSVQLPSRADLRTRITCRLQYQYTALRARAVQAVYVRPLSFFVWKNIDGSIDGRLWLTRSMVMGACESVAGWALDGEVRIESPRPQIIEATGINSGVYIIRADVAPEYVLSFRANFRQRWQQTITEDYVITLVAPALEAQIGQVAEEIGATLRAEFNQPDWQTDDTVEPVIAAPALGDVIQPWQPNGAAPSDRDECMRTLLDRAWVRLYDASRSGRVQFSLPLRPDLWLDTWLQIETDPLRAAGKIVALRHVMDADNGSAITDITVAVGLPGNTDASQPSWTLPAAPEDDYATPLSAYGFEIGTFVGGEISSPPFDESNMIGFSTNYAGQLSDIERDERNWYPHQFSMRAPALAAEDRDPRVLPALATIETDIPTDPLEIL